MFHQRNGRSVPPGGGAGGGAEGEEPPDGVNGHNGHAHYQPQQPQFYGYNMREDKPRGGAWKKDATGAWIRDKGGGSTSNLSSNLSKLGGSSSNLNLSSLGGGSSVGNSLRNRRRTNSNSSIYIPSLNRDAMNGGDHSSGSPGGGNGGNNGYYQSQRGSSASPRAPNSKGFWVQEPDDFHQRWVDTHTPVSEGNGTPLTWPPTGGGGGGRGTSTTCSSQPSSPRKLGPGTPPPMGSVHAATLPKVYKSQATWVSSAPTVRNSEDQQQQQQQPVEERCSSPGSNHVTQVPNINNQMSGDGGEGGGGGGGEVLDFQNRIKRFQQSDAHHQQQLLSSSSSSRTTSSSSQVKSSRMSSSQSHSSSNLLEASKQSSELKSTKTNLSELKSSMSEVKSNISEMSNNVANRDNYNRSIASPFPGSNKLKSPGFGNMGSMDALNDGMKQLGSSEQLALPDLENDFGLETLPDHNQMSSSLPNSATNGNGKNRSYEQSKMTMTSSSKTKVVTDNNSYESATATGQSQENCKVQSGDVSYEESSKKAANKSKLTIDGVTAEKAAAISQNERKVRAGDVTHREGSQVKGASMKLSGEGFSVHKSAVSEANQRSTNTPVGSINHESSRQATNSGLTIKTKGVCTQQSSSTISSQNNFSISGFEDLDILGSNSQPNDIQSAIMRYSGVMSNFVEELRQPNMLEGTNGPNLLNNIDNMIRKAWSVPTFGHELGFSLCNVLRNNGGLDILIDNCQSEDTDLKFNSAKVLEQCLTTENRGYVAEKGLENVVSVACDCTASNTSVETSRVGTGILEHLFKHSEGTCSDIIKLGGLDAVLYECRKKDIETLRHCAGALANLSLYGGSENQQAMIERNVPMWLFPLAFHPDDNIKYYAFLAIAALGANKEIEAAVLQSGSLNLVEPFLAKQNPEKFANSTNAHRHGQSKSWLKQLVPVLYSKREEAKNLAAFHFSMEAGVKAKQENLQIFEEIGAIEPLKEVASSPNAIASKYAAHALRLMGEEVPHKLSQQVPVWTSKDVSEWVKQIGFTEHADNFASSRVDGDLLLQLAESNLYEDIGIRNGILRQRFQRELRKLKLIADYSSCDHTNLNGFLTQLDNEFAEYTYRMLQAGVTKDLVRYLTEEQLRDECGILNSIHRQRIRELIMSDAGQMPENSMDKNLDVFISYRRSNGSQLASLLKVHLQLKGFSVFIDVERLEAGKFDNNLLSSIRQAKNFLLVLTPMALERCINDMDCKDWVHKEIVEALQSGCNIIPIIDNFQWPEPEELPEDMRAVCYFNGVRWIHDYQDACVDKLERFMRGEMSTRSEGGLGRYLASGPAGGMATPGTPSTAVRNPPLFQRTISTESGKGSSCSDKDFAKD